VNNRDKPFSLLTGTNSDIRNVASNMRSYIKNNRRFGGIYLIHVQGWRKNMLVICLMLVSCLVFLRHWKWRRHVPPKCLIDFHYTTLYPEDRTLHNHRYENLKPYLPLTYTRSVSPLISVSIRKTSLNIYNKIWTIFLKFTRYLQRAVTKVFLFSDITLPVCDELLDINLIRCRLLFSWM
jgi:hypothetical protein